MSQYTGCLKCFIALRIILWFLIWTPYLILDYSPYAFKLAFTWVCDDEETSDLSQSMITYRLYDIAYYMPLTLISPLEIVYQANALNDRCDDHYSCSLSLATIINVILYWDF